MNSIFNLTPENFDQDDVITNHVTFFVEKAWLEENGVHQWSVQFNRWDAELAMWVPLLGKLDREDEERLFYTVAPPSFSLWAITGAAEVPPVRFTADNLQISPASAEAGQEIQIQLQVSNNTNVAAEYNAVLWLNGDVDTSQSVVIGANASEVVSFTTVQLVAGDYIVRVDKLLGDLTVTAPTAVDDGDNNLLIIIIVVVVVVAVAVSAVSLVMIRRRRQLA